MSGKHLINKADDAVDEALLGFTFNYPALGLLKEERAILSPEWSSNKEVGVISGGGSGHEPFPAGFVGAGMLTAAVCGGVFASPPSSNILRTIETITAHRKAGCLVIIPNYTGDCLNFGLAIERARLLGMNVEQVVVGEDCSIPEDKLSLAGKRALPGILLVIKVAGALARMGKALDEVAEGAKLVADNLASCSVGLQACAMLGQKELMFETPEDEVVYGQGLHGEDGYERKKLAGAAETASYMIQRIRGTLALDGPETEGIVILVNNFGGLTQLELQIFVKEVCTQLADRRIKRVYSGHLMTSLDGVGLHLTILRLPIGSGAALLQALDLGTRAPSWPGCEYTAAARAVPVLRALDVPRSRGPESEPELGPGQRGMLVDCLRAACGAIIAAEERINELDRGCGDADCGSTHKRLAEGILSQLEALPVSRPGALLLELAGIAERQMGGTSGAIYSLLFTAAGREMGQPCVPEDWLGAWLASWCAGIHGIKRYSKARLGDKTLIDVLEPTLVEVERGAAAGGDYRAAARIAAECAPRCAERTRTMEPRAGRASYVHDPEHRRKLDAGACAAALWMGAVALALQKN